MSRYDPDYVMMMVSQRHKELSREAEQSRLLKAARPRPPVRSWTWTFRAVTGQFRIQVLEWISRLECNVRASIAGNPCD